MKKILVLFILSLLLSGCTKPALVKKTRTSLGTITEITVADRDKSRQFVNQAIKLAFEELERVEGLLSKFNSHSDISRINAEGYIYPIKVSPETISLIKKSIEFSQLTNGAFDITMSPLMKLWGFGRKYNKHTPSPEQLKQTLERVGYKNIDIISEEQSIFLAHPVMSLDLGGIAKGYAVDKAIVALRKEGIEAALLNAGGDIYCLGGRNKNKKWRVAIQHPRKKNSILTVLELEDMACATSGDYQKYIQIDDKRYSHIINPKSGYPCTKVPTSVTVLAEDCVSADALATSIFVLGPKKGIDLINRLENTEAIVVSLQEEKLDILLSRGLKDKLKFNE